MAPPIEEIISQDPHIVAIIPAEVWDFPEIDYSRFKEDRKKYVAGAINVLQKLLSSSPYIVDNFSSNSERRSWRDQICYKYKDASTLLQSNALRRGTFGSLLNPVAGLQEAYGAKDKDDFTAISNQVLDFRARLDTYDTLDNMQKVAFVKDLKQKVYHTLQYLGVRK